jgi:hypothetical protein
MVQFRNTNYWVTESGELYKYWPKKVYTFKRGTKIIPERWQKLKVHCTDKDKRRPAYNFSLGDRRRIIAISRVVAECYLGPIPEYYEVDHIDNNPLNNHYTNLQYLTKRENVLKSPKNWKLLIS